MSVIKDSPLRVLLVTDCPDVYGAERWNARLLRGLHHNGHHVAIAQPQADNDVTRDIADAGIRQHWMTPLPLDNPWRVFAVDGPGSVDHAEARAILRDERPDVIVFSDGEPGSNLPAKEVARDAGIPSIAVSHLGDDLQAKEREFAPWVRTRIREALASAQAVVGVSQANVDSLVAAFYLEPTRMHVVPNGRPSRFFAPIDPAVRDATRAALGVADDQVLFLTVARPHRNKKYSLQLDVIRRLQSHALAPKIRFAWVGGGMGSERLAAVVQLHGLADVITACGYMADPTPMFAAADAFVLSSVREGAPLAIIEAMGAGLPVIATNVGGVADLLGGTGILLPDPNEDLAATADALHDSIVRVAADPALRQRLGAAGRARAIADFGEDLMIQRYTELIRSVAQS